jgi:hypothetical protein
MKKKKEFPEWAIILYRGARASVGAGIAQALVLQPDWSDPKQAGRTLLVAFGAGFLTALGKWIRDYLDSRFGYDEKSTVAKTMII